MVTQNYTPPDNYKDYTKTSATLQQEKYQVNCAEIALRYLQVDVHKILRDLASLGAVGIDVRTLSTKAQAIQKDAEKAVMAIQKAYADKVKAEAGRVRQEQTITKRTNARETSKS